MIQLYTAPSCLGCRKVKRYFKEHDIKFTEKSIINTPLKKDDIYKMLIKSENGVDDIISTRSKVFKEKGLSIEDMNLNELVEFVVQNPTVLRRPIIINDYELQVGYNEDDITIFLPQELRERECSFCVREEDCEYISHIKFVDEE